VGDRPNVAHRATRGRGGADVPSEQIVVRFWIGLVGVELDNPILLAHRQIPHEHRVVHGEHRDGHPNPDSENHESRRGERLRATETAQRNPHVLPKSVHAGILTLRVGSP